MTRPTTRHWRLVRTLVALLGLSLALAACKRCGEAARPAPTTTGVAARTEPYETESLARSLQPGETDRLLRQLDLRALSDLPLYELELSLDPAQAAFAGKCKVRYPNRTGRPLQRLPLLLHPNAARELGAASSDTAELRVDAAKALAGPPIRHLEHKRETLTYIRFERPLRPNEWSVLHLRIAGRLRELPSNANDLFAQGMASLGLMSSGSAASGYGLLGIGDGIATLASAYPMVAPFRRGAFDVDPPPRFGDLAYNTPANFRLQVRVPRDYRVVTSLADPERPVVSDGHAVFRAEGAAVRDLVIVAGRDLVRKTSRVGTVAVSSVYRERDAAAGQRVLESATRALALFEKRFGPYPFRELDVAEATLVGGAGGVEFPGMVLVAGMFYRPPSASSNQLAQLLRSVGGMSQMLGASPSGDGVGDTPPLPLAGNLDQLIGQLRSFVVAHELAHQFFAGLVGSDCRKHPAVDEPLAQFAAGQYMQAVEGGVRGLKLFDLNAKANYAVYRMLGPDLPAAQPVDAFPNAIAYAGIVYGKAPYFYQALRQKLGAERFDTALRQATDDKRYQLVSLAEWLEALERASGAAPAVQQLAKRYFHELRGDEDLGVDESGNALFELLLGKKLAAQLSESFGMLGISPKTLLAPLLKQGS